MEAPQNYRQLIIFWDAKFWSDIRLQGHQPKQEFKLTKQKHSSICAVSSAECRTKDNDRFKLHKLNKMKTTFYIIITMVSCKYHEIKKNICIFLGCYESWAPIVMNHDIV